MNTAISQSSALTFQVVISLTIIFTGNHGLGEGPGEADFSKERVVHANVHKRMGGKGHFAEISLKIVNRRSHPVWFVCGGSANQLLPFDGKFELGLEGGSKRPIASDVLSTKTGDIVAVNCYGRHSCVAVLVPSGSRLQITGLLVSDHDPVRFLDILESRTTRLSQKLVVKKLRGPL